MALPINEPVNEAVVTCKTASVGTTPVAAWCVAPVKGRIVRTYAVFEARAAYTPIANESFTLAVETTDDY